MDVKTAGQGFKTGIALLHKTSYKFFNRGRSFIMINSRLLIAGIAALGLVIIIAVMTLASDKSQATAEDAAKAKPAAALKLEQPRDFSDWRLVCTVPGKGVKKQCEVFQKLMAGKSKDQVKLNALTAVVHFSQIKGKPVTLLTLTTPLGTVLPPGLSLKVDGGQEIKAPYFQCRRGGCIVHRALGKELLDKLKSGKTVNVTYVTLKGSSNLQLSLKGFGQAFDALSQSVAKN